MAALKIKMFGEFRVWRGESLVDSEEWGRQKARSLLKLLLTRPGRAFSKEEILDALWPGAPPERAGHSLRTTVSLLRRALEPDLEWGPSSCYLPGRRPGYAFDREAKCEVDLWEFEESRKRAQAAWNAGSLEEVVAECRAALSLARGELLAEDPYEEWAMEARERWRESRLSVLSLLSECLAREGRYAAAIEACESALEHERYSEEITRRLMLYRYCSGDQGLALSAYRSYSGALAEQLNAVPSPELTRLKEQIQARDVPGVDEGRRRYPRPRRPLRFPYSLSRTRFVGREREYAVLAERLREARDGNGAAVALEGEAGVGKTRLAEEVLGYARSRGARVLSGRCYERDPGPPLEPVMEALDPLPGAAQGSDFHEETGAHRALVARVIRESRREGALVLFVDDVQWADSATLDFLACLARRIPDERVLLLFTYRREDAPQLSGWLDGLSERRAVSALSLSRLSAEDVAELLAPMSSGGFEGLPSLADFLYRESEGNPFYAVEYLRWLIETGAVEIDSRRRVSGLDRQALRESALPSGVRSLIGARLRGLDGVTRSLLELAAVIGRAFDPALLQNAAGRGETTVHDAVEPLLAAGLIAETPEGSYRFSHDKLRQTLYEEIGSRRQRELHLRVAGLLEKSGGDPAELAHHYLRAEQWRPALESLSRAGREAERQYYWDSALEYYSRALETVERLPGSDEERFELLAAREKLLEHTDRREERAATVEEMFGLASRMGDRARIAEVHVRRTGVLPEPEAAGRAGREAVEIFRELGDAAGEALAHREVGYVLWKNGDHAGALEANHRALGIHRRLGDRRAEVGDVGNIAEVHRGMGNYQQALRWTRESVRLYREIGDGLGEAMRLATVSSIHHELGEVEAALPLALESLRICADLGVKNLLVAQHSACGTLYLELGEPMRALEHFRSAARIGRQTGYLRDEGYSTMSAGAALEHAGDPSGAADSYSRAADLLERAYEVSGAPAELSGRADALTLLAGVLHHDSQSPEEALSAYEAAAGACRQPGTPTDTRRLRKVLLGRAGLCWKTGRLEEAASGYEEALSLAREHSEAAHEAVALASLGVVYRDLGRLRESLRAGRAALPLLRELGDPRAEAYALNSLAESYVGKGCYPSAFTCLRRSLRLRRKAGDVEGEAGVLRRLSGLYQRLGEQKRAREIPATLEPVGDGAERRS